MKMLCRLVFGIFAAMPAVACSTEQMKPANPGSRENRDAKNNALSPERRTALEAGGVILPNDNDIVDPRQAAEAESMARSQSGDRRPFQESHDQGVTILPENGLKLVEDALSTQITSSSTSLVTSTTINSFPSSSTLSVTSTSVSPTTISTLSVTSTSVSPTTIPVALPCPTPQQVCANACATATASAYAYAFAHASVTACAWASAWACVYTFSPFSMVCAWGQSQNCQNAFAFAFGYGFATDTKTVCDHQCSK